MNWNKRSNRALMIALGVVLLNALTPVAQAIDHTKGQGEPYALSGKRLVFTNWFFVRVGQLDWADSSGKSTFGSNTVKAGPWDNNFRAFQLPHGIRLTSEPALRLEKPILSIERPWEQMGISVRSLLFEDGKYRMWATCGDAANVTRSCYYESTDGKNWDRPNLGLVEYHGSKENNLIPGKIGVVFKDPTASATERYKAVIYGDARIDFFEKEWKGKYPYSVLALEQDPGRIHALFALVSPDGLNWTQLPEPIAIEPSTHEIVIDFDPNTRKYILYTCSYMLSSRAEGQPNPTERIHGFASRYGVGRSESADFRHFPPSEMILESENDWPPTDNLFTNCKTSIPGAPDEHLMFPAMYHRADDTSGMMFYASFDNKIWHKASAGPLLETANFGRYDGGAIFAVPNLVELPEGDWVLPYTGKRFPHKYPRALGPYSTSFAVWPMGRLAALEAPEHGEFWTVGIMPPGRTIRINAVTARAGEIRVETCDFNGQPVAGHTLADAKPIIGDQYRTQLQWGRSKDIGVEDGKPVILHFVMDRAKIYGLDFE